MSLANATTTIAKRKKKAKHFLHTQKNFTLVCGLQVTTPMQHGQIKNVNSLSSTLKHTWFQHLHALALKLKAAFLLKTKKTSSAKASTFAQEVVKCLLAWVS